MRLDLRLIIFDRVRMPIFLISSSRTSSGISGGTLDSIICCASDTRGLAVVTWFLTIIVVCFRTKS